MFSHKSLFLGLFIVGLAACSNPNDGYRGEFGAPPAIGGETDIPVVFEPTSGDSTVSTVQCAVQLSTDAIGHQQSLTVTVRAAGGTAPYYSQYLGSFASEKVVSGSYNNTTSSNLMVSREFSITDALGAVGTCRFQVTVLPASAGGVTGSSSACSLSAATGTPKKDEPLLITLDPKTSSSYALKRILFQNDWWQDVNAALTGLHRFNVVYRTRGPRSLTAILEKGGQSYSCSLPINVVEPKVELTAAPATFAPVGGTILVTANILDFPADPLPTLEFSASDPAITLVRNGNQVSLSANDALSHRFELRAFVTQSQIGGGILTATKKIDLEFGATTALSCNILVPAGLKLSGTNLSFPVVTSGGQSATFESADPGITGTLLSGGSNPMVIRYAAPGVKTISVAGAKSASGQLCNGTGFVSVTFSVGAVLSACSGITTPNPSLVGTVVRATATLGNGFGIGPFSVEISSPSPYFQIVKENAGGQVGIGKMVRFKRPGTYDLTYTVTDHHNGATSLCTSQHNVYEANTFAVAQDTPGNRVRVFKGNPPVEILAVNGFAPFSDVLPGFQGGVRVAVGDLNADGTADIVTAAGYNGGLKIRAFHGGNLSLLKDFTALSAALTNRSYVAAGDINADGHADIVVGPGCDSPNSLVEIYGGSSGNLVAKFQPLSEIGGNRVAVGDVDGDGFADVVISSCVTSRIKVYRGCEIASLALGASPVAFKDFEAYPGVAINHKVAVGDVNGDGMAEIITGTGGQAAPYIKIFEGSASSNVNLLLQFLPFGSSRGINFVGAVDVNGDGKSEVLVGGDPTVSTGSAEARGFSITSSPNYLATQLTWFGQPNGRLMPFGSFGGRLYVGGMP